MKFKALDLFCGSGGVSKGLQRTGFHVTGVDLSPQPHYCGDVFHQADALTFPLEGFDIICASPPCQAHTALKSMPNAKQHLDLIPETRERLKAWGGIYIIENVPGAPLRVDVMLCGTMFGLGTADGKAELRRHRWFESNFRFELPPPCQHGGDMVIGVYGGHGRDRRRIKSTIGNYGDGNGRDYRRNPAEKRSVGVYGHAVGSSVRDVCQQFSTDERRQAMGIDWMNGNELSQAIPPAYSEWLGRQVMQHLEVKA